MGFQTHEMTTDYTKQLCKYIKETTFEDIPPMVIERAKMFVLHTIGVALCAIDLPQGRDVVDMAKRMSGGGEGEATLWGDGAKVSMEAAGLAAGALGDMLDWEDCSWTGHPSCGVIPAAVIGAEAMKRSGKELLTAVVLGYEVYQRVALAAHTNLPGYNIFAALVPFMRLFDLTEEEMNQCLGLGTACGIIPANVHERTMSDSLNYQYGYRVDNAVTMARCAKLGYTGMKDAFDDPAAYIGHMESITHPGRNDETWLTRDLGEEFLMMDALLVKHWPSNIFVQTYVEVVHKLQEMYDIDPDEIEEILVSPAIRLRMWYTQEGYRSLTQAQFSLPYGIACAFYHPEPGSVWYQEETMKDPRVIALMNKVKADGYLDVKAGVKPTEGLGAVIRKMISGYHPEKFITVRMKDGREYKEGLFQHPGHPSYMLTREGFADRFRTETRHVLAPEKAEQIIQTVFHLDACEDVSQLTKYLY